MSAAIEWLKAHLADDWRNAWRWSSMRLHAAVLILAGLYEAMPALDPSIAAMLPQHLQAGAIGLYALGSIVLRMTKAKCDGQPHP